MLELRIFVEVARRQHVAAESRLIAADAGQPRRRQARALHSNG
jgi:hypothetical protein